MTGEVAIKEVYATSVSETDEFYHIHVNGEEIVATGTHPFYVYKFGWTTARALRAGDILVLLNGELVTVEWIDHEILESPIKVYNFEVEDFHTYFVGESGILVHNGKKCTSDNNANEPNDTPRVYSPTKKHKPGYGWGSDNPIPDLETGQKLLDSAYSSAANKQLYNLYDGQIVKFQPDTVTGWHAYTVINTSKEVPTDVLKQMLNDGLISKSQYNKYIKNK